MTHTRRCHERQQSYHRANPAALLRFSSLPLTHHDTHTQMPWTPTILPPDRSDCSRRSCGIGYMVGMSEAMSPRICRERNMHCASVCVRSSTRLHVFFVYVCTHIFIYMYMFIFAWTGACATQTLACGAATGYVQVCMYIHICICTYMYTYIYIYIYIYIYVYKCVCNIYVCAYVHIFKCVRTYIHTHICTYSQKISFKSSDVAHISSELTFEKFHLQGHDCLSGLSIHMYIFSKVGIKSSDIVHFNSVLTFEKFYLQGHDCLSGLNIQPSDSAQLALIWGMDT